MKILKTLKVRIKDKHSAVLNRMAASVNIVWNYVNELSSRSIRERGVFLSGYDIQLYTKGSSKELGLCSKTVQMVGHEYATRRLAAKTSHLKWRKTRGTSRSLGWIPVSSQGAKFVSGQVVHNGKRFDIWDSYGLENYKFRQCSFNEDSRGRWYFNACVEVEIQATKSENCVGIDLGLKDTATCSDGTKLQAGRFYQGMEAKLAIAQRAKKKARTKAIHAKIANRRKDALHKFSRQVVDTNGLVVVGNVSSNKLVKTHMAKSVLDAGWGQLKTMLEYKCAHAGSTFKVVDEAYTTQTCSHCGCLPGTRPRGIAGLGIREWTCSECGVTHDRDINAARNILALGYERPAEGRA